MYGYTIGYPTSSLEYLILRYDQVQGLSQCNKPWVTEMFALVWHIFCNQILIILYSKFLIGIPDLKLGINMDFIKMHSIQVCLVLNFMSVSISPHYHVIFNEMFSTVAINTASDPEVWIRLFI